MGPIADVMWARPDGSKVLLAETEVAEYVTGIYPFDQVETTDVSVRESPGHRSRGRRIDVGAGRVQLSLSTGGRALLFPPRPRFLTATVERWMARALLGVNAYGVSPTGVEEWYRTQSVQLVTEATASINDQEVGPLSRIEPPVGFGFSEPPARPTHVRLRVDLRRSRATDDDRSQPPVA